MPRTCTICASPQHQAIDQALVAGTPYRAVAERFAASPPSVYRHQQGHLPATMLKAREAQEVAHADGLLAQLQSLQQKTLEILARAEGTGDLRSALAALRELRGTVELTAKISARWLGKAVRATRLLSTGHIRTCHLRIWWLWQTSWTGCRNPV